MHRLQLCERSCLYGLLLFILAASKFQHVNAHIAAFAKGMYCMNGTDDQGHEQTGLDAENSNSQVIPLYQLPFKQWWFHHVNNCDAYPPADGDILELPAGGSFTVELAVNRAFTSFSYGGKLVSDWPDGQNYPDDLNIPTCITSPNMHTQNESMAAGTAFAISYQSDLHKVTPDNLAVFTVRYHTPFKRLTTYDVPAAMPPCPTGGCICAWGWVANGCGEPNIYHQGFKCNVTNSHSSTPIAPPKPPVWCEGYPNKCVKGAKQMIYWNQLEGNNIVVEGMVGHGEWNKPGYNSKCGFGDGAQNDIFAAPEGYIAVPNENAAQDALILRDGKFLYTDVDR